MPLGLPGISVSSTATIEADTGATYHASIVTVGSGAKNPSLDPDDRAYDHASLVATSLRDYPTGGSFYARFTPNDLDVAVSGVSYFPRIDWISTPDFTVPPPSGEDVIFGASGFPVDPGSTVYISSLIDTVYSAIAVPMPQCTMTEIYLHCTDAPGSGKSFTYHVLKNNTATALTGVISNASTSATLTGQSVIFSAGDMFAVRVVTDTGSTSTYHSYSIKIS